MHIPLSFEQLLRPHLPFAAAEILEPGDDLAGLGLDSMSIVQLLADIEDEYGIELPDDILNEATFATVGSLWQVLAELLPLAESA
ncbi:MAG: phosphopantetheine-binding protein [Jatrophihabitantaceae bacterium]